MTTKFGLVHISSFLCKKINLPFLKCISKGICKKQISYSGIRARVDANTHNHRLSSLSPSMSRQAACECPSIQKNVSLKLESKCPEPTLNVRNLTQGEPLAAGGHCLKLIYIYIYISVKNQR